MKNYVRCKACGYIMEEGKVKDCCPACGVNAKMFEPYTEKMSEKRKKILDLHIHPIVVHMPQAFAFFLLIGFCVISFLPDILKNNLFITLKVIALCLPFVIVGAFLSGLIDAKIRFKKTNTPILKLKIINGMLFFLLSVGIVIQIQLFSATTLIFVLTIILQSFLAFICSAVLGKLGASLTDSKFPG